MQCTVHGCRIPDDQLRLFGLAAFQHGYSNAGGYQCSLGQVVIALSDTAVLQTALLKQGIDVNASQADGSTALHWAAHWNDGETADLLITSGAKANVETDLGVTPLYLAAEIGSAAMVEKLFDSTGTLGELS